MRALNRVDSSLGFLYFERGIIERDKDGVVFLDESGKTLVPLNRFRLLMMGPGTSVFSEAVKVLTASGSLLGWCGEEGGSVLCVRGIARLFGEDSPSSATVL